jgi:hypothetical protein
VLHSESAAAAIINFFPLPFADPELTSTTENKRKLLALIETRLGPSTNLVPISSALMMEAMQGRWGIEHVPFSFESLSTEHFAMAGRHHRKDDRHLQSQIKPTGVQAKMSADKRL